MTLVVPPLKKSKKVINRLTLLAVLLCCGYSPSCSTPAPKIVYKDKPQTVAADIGPFNATDYEIAAADFRQDGDFQLTREAEKRARNLRKIGDKSTKPTQFSVTVRDLEDAAFQWEAEGKHALAQEAREAARRLRSRQSRQVQPVQKDRRFML